MGQVAAIAAIGALGFAQYKAQGAAGKYNQSVQNRNAEIAEQEAAQLEKQLEFDIARFDQQFQQVQGQTNVSLAKSGVDMSGTSLRILRYNAEQAELQRDIMDYNSKVAQSKKIEEANFARIQGTVARQQARIAQIGTLTQTGTSLLTMSGGFGGGSTTQQLNMQFPAQYGTF
jgi:hypothetical protein